MGDTKFPTRLRIWVSREFDKPDSIIARDAADADAISITEV